MQFYNTWYLLAPGVTSNYYNTWLKDDNIWICFKQSAYFNNYEANREGFSKLYRKLADDAWDDAIDLIKYMAKRGFNMNYDVAQRNKVPL